MIYRNIYFKECNHVKVVFEKNAKFNVLSNHELNLKISIEKNLTLFFQHNVFCSFFSFLLS